MSIGKRICIECGKEKDLTTKQFAMTDFGVNASSGIEFDDVCRSCREEEEHAIVAARENRNGKRSKAMEMDDDIFEGEDKEDEYWDDFENVSMSLAQCVGGDFGVLTHYTEDVFLKRIGRFSIDFDFKDVVDRAAEIISEAYAIGHEDVKQVGPGTYVVFGDSCGSFAETGVVRCIEKMCQHLDARPIHVGNLLDHHGLYSPSIMKMKDLIVIGHSREMYDSSKACEKYGVDFVRGAVEVAGVVNIRNQFYRSNMYTVSATHGLHVEEKRYSGVILNMPLFELHTHTKNDGDFFVATVGCVCRRHQQKRPPKNVKPKNIQDVMKSFPNYFQTGARQNETNKLWRHGMMVLHVDSSGHRTVIPCEIKKVATGDGKGMFCTGYYGDIITEHAVVRSQKCGLVVGDIHVPKHDPRAIDVVDQVAEMIKPDYLVNLGDHINCSSFNHHKMDRNEPLFGEDVASEFGNGYRILKLMSEWAKELYYMFGNHERFLKDFAKKYPQMESLLNMSVMSNAVSLGYRIYEEKGVIKMDDVKFLHGEMRKYGASGDSYKKNAAVFDSDTVWGHCHRPGTRLGSHSIGFLGDFDQSYNETEASNWVQGFGVVSHYMGAAFINTIAISRYVTFVGKKRVEARSDVSKWENKEVESVNLNISMSE